MNLNPLSILDSIGIKARLIVGFGLMVALASACGIMGVMMASKFQQDTTAMLEGPVASMTLASEAWEGVLEAKYAQERFKGERDKAMAAEFNTALASAVQRLDKIEQRTDNAGWKKLIGKAKLDASTYRELFDRFYALNVEMGLSEKLGLQGKLRAAVHQVEEDLKDSGHDELTVLMLMCRRHEKDYLLRGDREKYLGRIDQRLTEFWEAVDRLAIGDEAADRWEQNWIVYRDAMHEMADKRDEIVKIEQKLNAKAMAVGVTLREILETAPEIDTSAIERARSFSVATLGVVVVVGLAMGVWLIRSITAPLASLTAFARTIASGDLRVEPLQVRTNDEIGQLAHSMETMQQSIRDVVGALRESAEEMSSATTRVSASATQTVDGMQQQARLVDQASAAVIELSASAEEVANKSGQASDHADASGDSANQGSRVVEQTIDGMRQINEAVTQGSASVTELGRRSDEIGAVIAVINDIADQTNLLALNAAIEAARAGEQGRGFAVVADEVRKLADRTTHATKEVEESINAIREDTGRAVQQMQQGTRCVESGVEQTSAAGDSLGQIKSYAVELSEMVSTIAAASREQSQASSDVSRTIQEISNVTHEVADSARASSTAMQDLSQRASGLLELAGRFRV